MYWKNCTVLIVLNGIACGIELLNCLLNCVDRIVLLLSFDVELLNCCCVGWKLRVDRSCVCICLVELLNYCLKFEYLDAVGIADALNC